MQELEWKDSMLGTSTTNLRDKPNTSKTINDVSKGGETYGLEEHKFKALSKY